MDDFAVMLIFFGRVNAEMEDIRVGYLKVIIGQTIGFSVVVGISFVGLIIGALVPEQYIDLVGLFPFLVGCQKLWEVAQEEGWMTCQCLRKKEDLDYSKVPASDGEGIREETLESGSYNNPTEKAPQALYKDDGNDKEDDEGEEAESNIISESFNKLCRSCMDPFVLEVVVYALACSSDNIAIYISIFASMQLWEVLVTTLLFYICLGLNIATAMCLMRCRAVSVCFEDYSKYFVPALLIVLGLVILSDSILWPWN
jgi:cadmium resistance protein CadD (predicted permease)